MLLKLITTKSVQNNFKYNQMYYVLSLNEICRKKYGFERVELEKRSFLRQLSETKKLISYMKSVIYFAQSTILNISFLSF